MKTLIGIDIQPDFITGALANKDAEAIIPDIVEFIKNWQGPIVFTRDTHVDGIYENSLEGKYLPADKGLKHCIHGTEGWMVRQDVANAAGAKVQAVIDKPTFGYTDWNNESLQRIIAQAEEIVLIGFCTEICVLANAVILRAMFPDKPIKVIAKLTEGVTKEAKEHALAVLRAQEIEVI